jgi:molybdopterin-guanine dinucleotide biosynthesis protein A
MHIGGIVLCGGQSRRMGRPKAWLPFAGEPMLCRVVRLLSEVVSPVVVVAARGQDLPPLPQRVSIVRDLEPGKGPLQGLLVGLSALPNPVEAAYVTSCDVPFLQPGFVYRLIELRGIAAICVPEVGGYRHPLAGVYGRQVAPIATKMLVAGFLRLGQLLERATTRFVHIEELRGVDPDLLTLRNLNTPEEYEAALRDMENCRRLQGG